MDRVLMFFLGALLLGTFFLDALSPASAEEMKTAMVEAHNAVRGQVQVDAVAWSDSLAAVAKQWAERLRVGGCQLRHRPVSGEYARPYGENLYLASARRWTDGTTEVQEVTPQMVVKAWADEANDYRYEDNSCSGVCGHYTQIVWRNTTHIGCAMTICDDKSQIWVCNYDPPGNYRGQRPY